MAIGINIFPQNTDGGGRGGAISIVVASTDNTIQQNGTSTYDPDTQQLTVNLSATNAGEGGIKNVSFVSSTILQPGESVTLTVTWDAPFTDANYVPVVSAYADTNLPILANVISGSLTTTNMQVKVTNDSNFATAIITITAIAQSNT